MKKSEQVISYEDNISVSMVDDSLIGRLQSNQANYLKIKQVEIENNGQTDTYLFFYLSGTKWDDIITNDDVFSEYVLCAADKGAEHIDRVFYYTGDYTGIESMDIGDLQKIIDNSVCFGANSSLYKRSESGAQKMRHFFCNELQVA